MNCKILSRLLLATTCFAVSSVINLLSASEISNANNTEYKAQPSFYTEFTQNSVVEYAKSRGINFDDAKDTLGYQANCKELPLIIEVLDTISPICRFECLDKNCLATMLYATGIGLPINNFGNCSSADAKKMLYAITNLNSGNCKKGDATFNTGMSYVNGFLVYNMCLNILTTPNCLSIYQNFYSAKEALKDLLLRKISNDQELQQYANKLVSKKVRTLQNSELASTYLTTLLTSNYDELILPGKSFDNILFSKIADIFKTQKLSNFSFEDSKPEHSKFDKFGTGDIERMLSSSRRDILLDKHFPDLLIKAGINGQEFENIKELHKYVWFISNTCREAEHWFEIYRKKMDIWYRTPKDICKITGEENLTSEEQQKFLLLSELYAKRYISYILKSNLYDAFGCTSEDNIEKEYSNLDKNFDKCLNQYSLASCLLFRINSLKNLRFLRKGKNRKSDFAKIRDAIKLELKYIDQFRHLDEVCRKNIDDMELKITDKLRMLKDNDGLQKFLDRKSHILEYIRNFFGSGDKFFLKHKN